MRTRWRTCVTTTSSATCCWWSCPTTTRSRPRRAAATSRSPSPSCSSSPRTSETATTSSPPDPIRSWPRSRPRPPRSPPTTWTTPPCGRCGWATAPRSPTGGCSGRWTRSGPPPAGCSTATTRAPAGWPRWSRCSPRRRSPARPTAGGSRAAAGSGATPSTSPACSPRCRWCTGPTREPSGDRVPAGGRGGGPGTAHAHHRRPGHPARGPQRRRAGGGHHHAHLRRLPGDGHDPVGDRRRAAPGRVAAGGGGHHAAPAVDDRLDQPGRPGEAGRRRHRTTRPGRPGRAEPAAAATGGDLPPLRVGTHRAGERLRRHRLHRCLALPGLRRAVPPRQGVLMRTRTGRRTSFHPLPVAGVERLTEDSLAITFQVPEPLRAAYAFRAGQHVTVELPADGAQVRRSYSVCSTPAELAATGRLRIGVKEIPGGVFSVYAARKLAAGEEVRVLPPLGHFTTDLHPDRSRWYVALVAGSGITPVLSLLTAALTIEPASRFTVFYGNRYARSVMFADELAD